MHTFSLQEIKPYTETKQSYKTLFMLGDLVDKSKHLYYGTAHYFERSYSITR